MKFKLDLLNKNFLVNLSTIYRPKHFHQLMIKAVLLSRLAMTQDSIRNTHTQMLWKKCFRVKHSRSWLQNMVKTSSQRLMLHYTKLFITLVYSTKEIAMQLYTQFLPLSAHVTEPLNMRTRAYQGSSYTHNTYQTNFIHSWTVLQIQLIYHYN